MYTRQLIFGGSILTEKPLSYGLVFLRATMGILWFHLIYIFN